MIHLMLRNSLLFVVVLFFCACNNNAKHYVIGVSQCSEDIWRDKLNDELRMGAYSFDNAELRFVSAGDNDQKQIDQIDQFISDGIDLLIVSPNQVATITPAIDRAFDKGIPVIVFDRKTSSQKYTAYIGADNKLMGQEMGDYVEMPAKVTGNDCFTPWVSQNDWYETVKLNYGVDYQGTRQLIFCPSTPNTWVKMRDILLYWASMGIDGFRCDMAEMVPCDFWGWAIPQVKAKYPDIIFIAEVYNPHEYRNYIERGHFDYLYDKVGLYDTIRSVMGGNSATCITGAWQSVDDIQSHMLNFLENHDEQRIASKFFAGSAEKGKPALLVSALMNTNPMMIYFGQELGEQGMYSEGFSGQDGRTTIFDYWTIDLIRRWRNNNKFDGTLLSKEEKDLQKFYTKVLNICNMEKAIREGLFFDIMYVNYNQGMNEHRQFAFLRKKDRELIFVIANFDDQPARSWVKIPAHAFDCLDIPVSEKERECKDLLTGKKEKKVLIPDGTLYVELPANSGKVLKFKL